MTSDSWLEQILDADLSDLARGFTLPAPNPWPGRPFPRLTVPAAQVWQPSTPGQPPSPPPPDPHPQDQVSQALARRAD